MSLDNQVRLGTVYLSSTGASTGVMCDIEIPNLPDLKPRFWGFANRNARGNPEVNLSEVAGVNLKLLVAGLFESVADQIFDLFDDTLEAQSDFELRIESGAGDFTLRAIPNPENSFTWKNLANNFYSEVEINIITKKIEV